jgi:hypothetical protein
VLSVILVPTYQNTRCQNQIQNNTNFKLCCPTSNQENKRLLSCVHKFYNDFINNCIELNMKMVYFLEDSVNGYSGPDVSK